MPSPPLSLRLAVAATLAALAAALLAACAPEATRPSAAPASPVPADRAPLVLPWEAAGLTAHEAAAHLLNRFAYGPTPGQVEALARADALASWAAGQLGGTPDDRALLADLAERYPSTALPLREIGQTYPSPAVRLFAFAAMGGDGVEGRRMGAQGRAGVGPMRRRPDSMRAGGGTDALLRDIATVAPPSPEVQRRTRLVAERTGFRDLRELMREAMSAKVMRAVYAERQLDEVLTDFWLNHFNVSITKVNDAGPFVPAFERDAIRPHVLGRFRDMLGATARHPAMLFYLDTHRSNADDGRRTLARQRDFGLVRRAMGDSELGRQMQQQPGVNENYARELLELHTLGVDGGYSQADVEEAARVLTGWKVNPLVFPLPDRLQRPAERMLARAAATDGAYFAPQWHDAEAKVVLGTAFPAGGGAEELDRLLDLVAAHPSTARHLATKLAQKFVSDAPPALLVDALAATYLATDGDLRAVMRALVEHPAFWERSAVAAKVKTPLEVVASAVRAVGAEVQDPAALIRWTTRMGQPLYAYSAPTGYPERAAAWVNGAALLNRMNFGLDLALNRVDGVSLHLLELNGLREPASAEDALGTYLPILLPGRDHAETAALLLPTLRDPAFDEKVAAAARAAGGAAGTPRASTDPARPSAPGMETLGGHAPRDSQQLAQVVGLVLGSPAFQRQ